MNYCPLVTIWPKTRESFRALSLYRETLALQHFRKAMRNLTRPPPARCANSLKREHDQKKGLIYEIRHHRFGDTSVPRLPTLSPKITSKSPSRTLVDSRTGCSFASFIRRKGR